MTDHERTREMFARGWKFGNDWSPTGVGCSRDEAEGELRYKGLEFTAADVDAFCQGSIDGSTGDCFRLHYDNEPPPPCCAERRSRLAE